MWETEHVVPADTAYHFNTDFAERITNWLNFTCEVVLLRSPMVRPTDVCPAQVREEFSGAKRLRMRGRRWWGLWGTLEDREGCRRSRSIRNNVSRTRGIWHR